MLRAALCIEINEKNNHYLLRTSVGIKYNTNIILLYKLGGKNFFLLSRNDPFLHKRPKT